MTKFLSAAAVLGVLALAGCAQTQNNMAQPGNMTETGTGATPSGGAIPGQQAF